MGIRRNAEMLTQTIELAGRDVLDIGCGDGTLVRAMAEAGARVTGLEVSAEKVEGARQIAGVAGETYIQGRAEDLALNDASLDVVVFFKSLHHVPAADMMAAFAEAMRVLRPGGLIYVAEPIPAGPLFELMLPVHDETEVRAHASNAIRRAVDIGLAQADEFYYSNPTTIADFPTFRKRMAAVDAGRAEAVARHEETLRQGFLRLGQAGPGGQTFNQPMRVNLLQKAGAGAAL